MGSPGRPPRLSHSSRALFSLALCPETVRKIRDGKPRTATSTFTQLPCFPIHAGQNRVYTETYSTFKQGRCPVYVSGRQMSVFTPRDRYVSTLRALLLLVLIWHHRLCRRGSSHRANGCSGERTCLGHSASFLTEL